MPRVQGQDPDDLATEAKLRKPLTIDWREVKFVEAMKLMSQGLDVSLLLDPEGLEEAGVTETQEVRIDFHEVRGRNVLRELLSPLHLTYILRNGVVIITSEEKAAEQLITRMYNIRDLLQPAKHELAASPAPLPVAPGSKVIWPEKEPGRTGRGHRQQEAEEIIELMQSTLAPDSWTDNGGSGSVGVFRGMLVVSQTFDIHERIEQLLERLRDAERSQVGDIIELPN
jgi:hypothetical protein